MAGDEIPSAISVRRKTLLILIFYTIPLIITGVLALVLANETSDWTPLILFATFLSLGVLEPAVWRYRELSRLSAWLRNQKLRRNPIDARTKAAILAEVPELSGVVILTGGGGGPVVDGKRLLLGIRLHGAIRPGVLLPDRVLFQLVHEARHIAVGASRRLMLFRWLKVAYMAAAGAIYIGLLLNVAVIFDDPFRTALTISLVVAPYIAAALNGILDDATNALDWYLEIDADTFALNRCRVLGRASEVVDFAAHRPSLEIDRHPPLHLRSLAIAGVSVRRMIAARLVIGWIAAVVPLVMSGLFTWVETETPNGLNVSLAAFYATIVLAAIATALIAAGQVSGVYWSAAQAAVFRVFLRTYITANRLLGWLIVACAGALVAKAVWNWPYGQPPDVWLLVVVASFLGAGFIYMKASDINPRARWVISAAVCDACRLWVMVWLIRATGVLPFFDDLPALGWAMQKHSDFIAIEVARIWSEETGWLLGAGVASGLGTATIALFVLRARAIFT